MLAELWSDIRYRTRALFRRSTVEREVHDELEDHLARQIDALERAGLSHDDAVRRARIAFGGIERAKELSRENRGTRVIESLVRDVRFAARSLRARPTFSLTVIAILALGIGTNTAVFTVIDALVLRPLPVSHPEALVAIGDPSAVNSSWSGSPEVDYVSHPLFQDVQKGNDVFTDVYASGTGGFPDVVVHEASMASTNPGATEHPRARFVSANFFAVLGLHAISGRTFVPDEDRVEPPARVLVISYDYWQRRFNGDRSAIGRVVSVSGQPCTIIGVAPPGFTGDVVGELTDIWLPLSLTPIVRRDRDLLHDRQSSWLQMMGRLRPGVTIAQARAAISALEAQSIRAQLTGISVSRFNDDLKSDPIQVESGARGFSSDRKAYGSAFVVVMAAVALVVLVVCANVANLMLVRASARYREMTIRMTLGASRRRLLQQLIVETLLLAVVAAALGLIGAEWGTRALIAFAAAGNGSLALDVRPNARVLAFTAGSVLCCAVVFGLLPALRATRVDLATALRAHGRSLTGTRGRIGRVPVGALLVIGQVALSTMLLIGSGILMRSMQRLLGADLGLDRDHLDIVRIGASRSGYTGERVLTLERELVARIAAIPGVLGASYVDEGLFSGGASLAHVQVPGFVAPDDSLLQVYDDRVGTGYFSTIGAHLLRGRDFTARDSKTHVAVVNETAARFYFAHRDPVGQVIGLDSADYTIEGVVRDVQEQDVRARPVRRIYLSQGPEAEVPRAFEIVVRTAASPDRTVVSVRHAIESVDHDLIYIITPLRDRVRESITQDRLTTQAITLFGAVALLLAALGLYGLMAYATLQRTSELGLRLALGARPNDLARMVIRQSALLAVAGMLIGVPVGLVATYFIRDRLYGVGTIDPPSLAIAVSVLLATALIAGFVPARRATRIDPLEALRAD